MKTQPNRSRKTGRSRETQPSAETLFRLGDTCCEKGDYAGARAHFQSAMRLDSLLESKVHLQFARIDIHEERWDAALNEANLALNAAAHPKLIARNGGRDAAAYALAAYRMRRLCYFILARMEEYVAESRRILAIAPDADIHNRLIFDLNFLPDITAEELYAEARRWDALYAAPLKNQILAHNNSPDPDRRIKVGYLSGDFCNHAIMKVIPPILDHYDRSQFETFVYAVGSRSDVVTERLSECLDRFVRLPFSRQEIVDRVRADGIDILVDLSSHTMDSADAYLAFALKPAPIEISWLGVWSTTGMSAMNYFFGGPDLPNPGTEHLFSETVYRLPRIPLCYRPYGGYAPIAPSPYFNRGHITFGCFNNPRKVTREVVNLWAAILHLTAGSHLLFKFATMDKPLLQQQFCRWFEEDGVSPDRIEFEDGSAPAAYLHCWGEVDIALDPFPYAGGTTTLDALWMGVPVVTLGGRFPIQSCGASIVRAAGLPAADTPEQYIELALSLASLVPNEPGLRLRVHESFRQSPLMDELGLVRAVEAAYRDMWRAWCRAKCTEDKWPTRVV